MSWLIALGAVIAFIVVAALLWRFWWMWPKQQADRYSQKISDQKALADIEDSYRKTVTQLFGGAAVLIAAVGAYAQFVIQQEITREQNTRQQKASEDQIKTSRDQILKQQESARDQLISQQVSKGFELLGQKGDDKLVVRLGGIYALEGVMNTSEQYHRPVLEALCAFVREATKAGAPPAPPTLAKSKQPPPDAKPAPEIPSPATDIQAALTVIGRRTYKEDKTDLSDAIIPRADLIGANLSRADLSGTDLQDADLSEADLSGAKLWRANLSGAGFHDANLSGAGMSGDNLTEADLSGADLSGAFLSMANLSGAALKDANLSGAALRGANLSDAQGLTQDQLNKACGDARTKLPSRLTIKPCPATPPK